MPGLQIVAVGCIAFNDIAKLATVGSDKYERDGFASSSGGSSGEVGIAQCRNNRSTVGFRTIGDGIQRLEAVELSD